MWPFDWFRRKKDPALKNFEERYEFAFAMTARIRDELNYLIAAFSGARSSDIKSSAGMINGQIRGIVDAWENAREDLKELEDNLRSS